MHVFGPYENAHTYTGRTYKSTQKGSSWEFNQETSYIEVMVLITTPLCSPMLVHQFLFVFIPEAYFRFIINVESILSNLYSVLSVFFLTSD